MFKNNITLNENLILPERLLKKIHNHGFILLWIYFSHTPDNNKSPTVQERIILPSILLD